MSDQDDFKQLFADATADIRPQGTYDDIRTRTEKVDPMARRWFLPSMAAAAVMALVIGGAFWITQEDGSPSSSEVAGTPDLNDLPQVEQEVPVYFVGDSAEVPKLFPDSVEVMTCEAPACRLLAAVAAAVSGTPTDPDYRSPWPAGLKSMVVNSDDTRILIDFETEANGLPDLADRPTDITVVEADLAIQQLVHTAQTALGQQLPVRFQLDHVDTPTILGVDVSRLIGPANADLVMAPVQISSPSHNQKFPPGDVTVTGVAAAFEANVVWELLAGADAVVKSGFATAAECCTLAPYEFVLKSLEPGAYTLVVHDEDMSGEDRPVNSDTKDIVVE